MGKQNCAFPGQKKRQSAAWGLMAREILCGWQGAGVTSPRREVWLCLGFWVSCYELLARSLWAAWPGPLGALSLPCRPLTLHTHLCPSIGPRGHSYQSKSVSFLIYWRAPAWQPEAELGLFLLPQRHSVAHREEYSGILLCSFVAL